MSINKEPGSERLIALLKHGVEHNMDHQEEIKNWAKQADDLGASEAKRLLVQAAEDLEDATTNIEEALEKLENREE
mgnify:CR=1 FL=1